MYLQRQLKSFKFPVDTRSDLVMIEKYSEIEKQLFATARKIRQFKTIDAQQRALGVLETHFQSSNEMLRRLEQDFKKLSEALLVVPA